ncbi:acyl-CoA dehydrogenase [Streptomyces sp. WI04-05B]|uniref:acyl-CoA dehydrogenase n=1 Tax=Streptomyces TaxID=1883 RepID=UPI0029B8409D|nr:MULTISPECIES: acyl-CoA dehydrogenase [unclassified Streptomyces]MDX2545915.1 acyl-CoA dehydrogenase [Streptomyces sp. WI04-05B]MDX2586474.1 acyl-CoA dehydrogenase [Streptomyces sp. WI04-05A]
MIFGGQFEQIHEPWRKLFATSAFRFREGLSPEERTALSYQRLRLVNDALADGGDHPERLAGDIERLTALHEWVGPADAGLGTIASIHYNLVLGSLLDHDGPRDLREFANMARTGTFLCTEAAHGNSATHLETTATYDPDGREFVLQTPTPGAGKFMPNTSALGGPKSGVVAARLIVGGRDQGVFLFLLPLSDDAGHPLPGVRIQRLPQTTTSPVDHCLTVFDSVRLPYEALLQADHGRLSPDGEFTSDVGSSRIRFLRSVARVTAGKLCMTAASLGMARHALAVAIGYAHTRHIPSGIPGDTIPLIAHRSHHAPLLDAIATTYAATLLHRIAVRQWAQATSKEDREAADRLVAIAKGWITWRARDVMTTCRERCGSHGLFLANGIAGQLSANEGTITAEGDNLVIWVKAAAEMLLNFTSTADAPSQDPDIASPDGLQDLLADIERVWHHEARTRLRSRKRGNRVARWNRAVLPALELVDAHARRLAAEALLNAANQASNPSTRRLLLAVHRLFALRHISNHSGTLLAQGHLTAQQVRQLPEAIDDILDELAPDALTLADGFAVSEEVLLNHPISALSNGVVPA